MNKIPAATRFFVQFQYTKKTLFFYMPMAALALLVLVFLLWIYSGLTNNLDRQFVGIKYHQRMMSIYNRLLDLQTQVNKSNTKESKEQLINENTAFLLISEDLKDWIKNNGVKNSQLYIDRLANGEEKFNAVIFDTEKQHAITLQELKTNIEIVKSELLRLFDFIIDLFDLQLYSHEVIGKELDSILNDRHQLSTYTALSYQLQERLLNERRSYIYVQLTSIILAFLGTGFVLVPYLIKFARTPLIEIKKAAEELSNGNLSTRIPIKTITEATTVAKSFNMSAQVFEKMMLETDYLATNLSQHSSNIFSIAQQQEQNLKEEEQIIQQMIQNSQDISRTVQDFSQKLDHVNNTIELTTQEISKNQAGLLELALIIGQMSSSAKSALAALASIKSEISKIPVVINTLVDIADQINLLSLNTAIRANKKGVKQWGFTVIANKIQELADQTAYTTLDLEEIVLEIHGMLPQILQDIDQLSQEIQQALGDANDMGKHLQKLLAVTQSQIATFQTINIGMQNQSEKTADIHYAVKELSQSTEITHNSIKKLYSEIESMQRSTEMLDSLTKKYTKHSEHV